MAEFSPPSDDCVIRLDETLMFAKGKISKSCTLQRIASIARSIYLSLGVVAHCATSTLLSITRQAGAVRFFK